MTAKNDPSLKTQGTLDDNDIGDVSLPTRRSAPDLGGRRPRGGRVRRRRARARRGEGLSNRTGRTDSDPSDGVGRGRSGITDSDPSDGVSCGRGRRGGRRTCTDQDSGRGSDPRTTLLVGAIAPLSDSPSHRLVTPPRQPAEDHGKFPALARLLAPVSVDDFPRALLGAALALRVPGHRPRAHRAPVTLAEIDAVLTGRPPPPDHQLVDAARTVEVDEYARDDDSIDPVRAVKRFAASATIVLNRLDEQARASAGSWPGSDRTRIHVQTNMYLTPRTAQGFPIHYDNHDVIIVRCEGRKALAALRSPQGAPRCAASASNGGDEARREPTSS